MILLISLNGEMIRLQFKCLKAIELGTHKDRNRLIRQDWVPVGGISAAAFGISPVGGNSFVQAMVKYK